MSAKNVHPHWQNPRYAPVQIRKSVVRIRGSVSSSLMIFTRVSNPNPLSLEAGSGSRSSFEIKIEPWRVVDANGGPLLMLEMKAWRVCRPEVADSQHLVTMMRSRIRICIKVKSWIRISISDEDPKPRFFTLLLIMVPGYMVFRGVYLFVPENNVQYWYFFSRKYVQISG